MKPPEISELHEMANDMAEVLGLERSPVGVKFIEDIGEASTVDRNLFHGHRYCQAVMKTGRGQAGAVDGESLACPAASAAFGFSKLPPKLRSGEGLTGFGIVSDPEVGRTMFDRMPRLEKDEVEQLNLSPLEETEEVPDVVVVEGEVEWLMWIGLAYLHARGGERVESSTAVLQAVCVDSTIVPYSEGRLNLSYGCYGCRGATDVEPSEAVLGLPVGELSPVVDHLRFLKDKAIPNSRSKRAYENLKNR